MQHTALTNSNSASGTGDRGNLPRCEFTFLHCSTVRRSPPRECSILDTSGRRWQLFRSPIFLRVAPGL